MKMTEAKTPVAFPVPDFDAVSAAFGADGKDYLTRDQMGDEFYQDRNRYTRTAQLLFFRGGKLEDFGLRLKKEIDSAKAHRAIRALLSSFAPKHEIKIGTVGYALSQWCDVIGPEPER
jgi:hypothetical protein